MRFARSSVFLFASATAHAQGNAPNDAKDIVVTGRALPVTRGDSAFDTAMIDRARILTTASNRLEDTLRDVGGVQQFRRADARSANPTSQGVTLRGLGGNASSRALVVLDGVPQGDPFGGFINWPQYAPARIGAVRVVRGGGSGVAGPGALAGTIEIDSIDASQGVPLTATLLAGSRASVDASGVVSGAIGGGFAFASLSHARGDGFVPIVAEQRGPVDVAAPYAQSSLVLRGVIPVAATTELQTSLSLFDDRRSRGTPFSRIATQGGDASVRLVGTGRLPFAATAYLQLRRLTTQTPAIDAARTRATLTLDQYNTPATGIGGRIELRPVTSRDATLRVGGDVRVVTGQTQERFAYTGGTNTRLREAGGSTLTLGAFADGDFRRGSLLLTAGGRVDRWRIGTGRLIERSVGTGTLSIDDRSAPRSGTEATGRVGAAWSATPRLTLRGAAYRGWRLPTLNELYRPFRVGADVVAANAALAPERSRGVEAGASYAQGRSTIAATAFANTLGGAIGNVSLGAGPGNFPGVGFVATGGAYRQRLNFGRITSRGVELDARVARGDWQGSASLAYVDARVRAAPVAAQLDGLRPAGVAPLQVSGTLAWRGLSATYRHLSAQFDDDLNLRRLAPADTLDLVADLPVSRALRLSVRAENLFDARVETAVSGTGVVERTAPRTLWFGLSYRR